MSYSLECVSRIQCNNGCQAIWLYNIFPNSVTTDLQFECCHGFHIGSRALAGSVPNIWGSHNWLSSLRPFGLGWVLDLYFDMNWTCALCESSGKISHYISFKFDYNWCDFSCAFLRGSADPNALPLTPWHEASLGCLGYLFELEAFTSVWGTLIRIWYLELSFT